MMRIGHGYDVHAFGDGDHVVLGGVWIDCDRGLVAHSDGDVMIHALCDAILGALAMKDIGHHFPDTDPRWKGANSRDLLRHVVSLMKMNHWLLGNADITVIAQKPRLANYLPDMKALLVEDCETTDTQLNIKATTTEKMGYIGRAEGISVHAVVLLVPNS